MNIAPIFKSTLNHNGQSVAYSVYSNPKDHSPNHAFFGFTRYCNKRFVIFSSDKDDCHLGLHVMLQEHDAKNPAATMKPSSTVH